MNTNTGLVEYAKQQIGKPYWFGCIGQKATEALWNSKANQYPRYYSPKRHETAKSRGDFGQLVHDCSGLIKAYIMGGKYQAKYDLSADAFFYSAKRSGEIKSIPEIPGLAVWRKGHIGVYIGGGKVIEAKGFDCGVVESDLKKRDFTHWLYIPDITYEDSKPVADPAPVREKPSASDEYYTVKKGDTLSSIAKRFNTTVKALQTLNKISNPNFIQIGEKILLPRHLEETAPAPFQDKPQTFIGVVNTVKSPLNVRQGPSMTESVIKQLTKGSKIELYSTIESGWYKLADNSGYVSAQYISR